MLNTLNKAESNREKSSCGKLRQVAKRQVEFETTQAAMSGIKTRRVKTRRVKTSQDESRRVKRSRDNLR